jgi:hypothetical protein
MNDSKERQLHDRATRGESLTEEERAQLEAWYAVHDAEEAAQLGVRQIQTGQTNGSAEIESLSALRAQIDKTLAQLAVTSAQIQKLAEENKALYQDVSGLRLQLAQRTPTEQE